MKTYTPAELRELADSRRTNPFFVDEVIAALHYAANVIEAADAAVTAERQRAEQGDAKDAARYQWLREHSDSMSLNPPLTVAKVTGWGLEGWSGDDLSSAIRAAMLASKPAVVEMKP